MPTKTGKIKTLVDLALIDPANELAAEHSVLEADMEEAILTTGKNLLSGLVAPQESWVMDLPSLGDMCTAAISTLTEAIGGLGGEFWPQHSTMTTTKTVNFHFNDRGVDVGDGGEIRGGLVKRSC